MARDRCNDSSGHHRHHHHHHRQSQRHHHHVQASSSSCIPSALTSSSSAPRSMVSSGSRSSRSQGRHRRLSHGDVALEESSSLPQFARQGFFEGDCGGGFRYSSTEDLFTSQVVAQDGVTSRGSRSSSRSGSRQQLLLLPDQGTAAPPSGGDGETVFDLRAATEQLIQRTEQLQGGPGKPQHHHHQGFQAPGGGGPLTGSSGVLRGSRQQPRFKEWVI